MNQILLTKNKYYKKKYLLIFQFTISIIIVSAIIYFLFNYFYKIKKQEYLSKELTNNYNLSLLYSNIEINDEKSNNNNIFVDIRVHMTQPVILAKSLNWRAFTGFGMNYVNGYTILSKLCSYANVCPPSLDYFKNLVMEVTK